MASQPERALAFRRAANLQHMHMALFEELLFDAPATHTPCFESASLKSLCLRCLSQQLPYRPRVWPAGWLAGC
jgi:hypothetical protein